MSQEDKTFALRFTLEASFPEDYTGDEDERNWLQEWEAQIKPQLLKSVFESLRRHDGWASHIRNRGVSPADEIEIVLAKDFSRPLPVSLKQ